jgi:hypothetical protein
MKTFYAIYDMPEQVQHQEYIRLSNIWSDGRRKLLDAANFLSSITSDSNSELDFSFTRPVSMPDRSDAEFYDSIRLELPYNVRSRLPQMLADFALVATALANYRLELDRPIPPTTETEK